MDQVGWTITSPSTGCLLTPTEVEVMVWQFLVWFLVFVLYFGFCPPGSVAAWIPAGDKAHL